MNHDPKPAARQDAPAPSRALSVLVVDDSHDYADALCELLTLSTLWQATPAYSAVQAIACARRCRPDAVLLDLELPPSTGMQLLESFEDIFHGCMPAVFAVSGNVALVETAAADHRIRNSAIKPADPAVLVAWLDDIAAGAGIG